MIAEGHSTYYLTYALVCAALLVTYVRIKSTEGVTITTKEFRIFQSGFITGYAAMILCELLSIASFYHTFVSLNLSLEKITNLYIVTIISTTVFGVLAEIADVGGKRDKCVLSAVLYAISMFTILIGTHYEMHLFGRIIYGAASALHHSIFEAYVIHEHTILGFPDDWLTQTFTILTHAMALVAAIAGPAGQTASSSSTYGCVGLCFSLFALVAVYITLAWSKDSGANRFMLSGFLFNVNSTVQSARASKQVLYTLGISTLSESSITIFTFFWAPWLASMVPEKDRETLPYEIIFSCYVCASMLGNYMYQLQSASSGSDAAFQTILIATCGAFFAGGVFQTSVMAFAISIFIQLCIGGYWPSIGYLRGRCVAPELRSTALALCRVATLVISAFLLRSIHHSPLLMLSSCAALMGVAAYLQNVLIVEGLTGELVDEEADQ